MVGAHERGAGAVATADPPGTGGRVMAILDFWTSASWLDDNEPDDAPEWPSEALTASQGVVWWTAALDTTEDE